MHTHIRFAQAGYSEAFLQNLLQFQSKSQTIREAKIHRNQIMSSVNVQDTKRLQQTVNTAVPGVYKYHYHCVKTGCRIFDVLMINDAGPL